MRNFIYVGLCVTFVSSCSYFFGGNPEAPHSLHDACSILDQRPSFLPAFKATERKHGVPVAVQMSIIYQESKFKATAKTPHTYFLWVIPTGRQSSAYGYAQALDGTWAEYRNEAGRWGARRDNINDATDFMGWYMTKTKRRLGISMGNTKHQYLAYHEGHAGYKRGRWKSKAWLVNVANSLEGRTARYETQLRRCGKI